MTKADVYCSTRLTESYWPADTLSPLVDMTLVQALREVAAEVPDRFALVEGIEDQAKRRRWTYAQLLKDVERVASAMLTKFKPGERVALWAPNVVEWEIIQLGCAMAGLILVTVNAALRGKELDYLLRQSESAGLFLTEEYRGHNMLETATKMRNNLPHLREIIDISDLEQFMNSTDKLAEFPEVKPNDPCMIMYTSGTTGYPKGAVLYHKGIINGTNFMANRAGMQVGGVWVNAMPKFHMGGAGFAALGTLQQRGTHVLVQAFEPALMLNLFESEKGTFALLVPTMVEAILDHPDFAKYNTSTLENILSGASKVEASLVRRVKSQLGCNITIVFGQTEMHGGLTQTHRDDSPEDQADTIGQPYPQSEVKIADPETGRILPLGETGEICCRGYQTMLEYFNMPAETAMTIKADGWLHSGDLGSMDERGFLKITGRIKDMIIRGSENIYPGEIEALLQEHPKVAKAAVIGVPDEYWGEQVAAFIIPSSPDNPPTATEMDEYCKENIARFKRPRVWYFVEEFPTTAAGKLQKYLLRNVAEKGEFKAETE